MALRIVGVARVGNEADIVEAFVRFNLQFLDALVVVADSPTDGTHEILQNLAGSGLPLTIEAPYYAGFQQGADTTRIARRLFSQQAADFVLPLDADEFLLLPRQDYLRAALPALEGRIGCWRWRNYAPTSLAPDLPILQRMATARADEPAPIFKVVLPATFAQGAAWLGEGHHCVFFGEPGNTAASHIAPMVELKAVRLAHFPIRSAAQATQKIANAERAFAAKAALAIESQSAASGDLGSLGQAGAHWRHLAAQLNQSAQADLDLLVRLALNYPALHGALPMPPTRHAPLV